MDWNELQKQAEEAFAVIPKGEYPFTIVESSHVKASTGKDMIKIKGRIDGGPQHNRTFFNNFVLVPDNPQSMGFFFRNMKALGLGPEFFNTQPNLGQVADALSGRSAIAVLDIRQYQGQDQTDVKSIKPPVGIGGMGAVGVSTPGGMPAAATLPAPGTPSGLPAAATLASVPAATPVASQVLPETTESTPAKAVDTPDSAAVADEPIEPF